MHTGQREHLPERVSTKDAHRIVGPTVLPVQVFLGESESLLLSHQLRTSVFKGEAHVPPLTLHIIPLHGSSRACPHMIS